MKHVWPRAGVSLTKTKGLDASGTLQRAGQLIRTGCRLGFTGNSPKALLCLCRLHAFKQFGQALAIAVAAALESDVKQPAIADLIADAGAAYAVRPEFH